MDKELTEIIAQIEKLSENSEPTEKQILERLSKHFKDKWNEKYIKAYLKREKKISEICKEFKIPPKRFYKVLKENGIEPKKYNRKK